MKPARLALAAALLAAGCVADPRTDPETHGLLVIESAPPGAEIFLDGTATGDVTPRTYVNINAGLRDIRLVLEGFQTSVSHVLVTGGEVARLHAQLEPLQSHGTDPEATILALDNNLSRGDTTRYGELFAPGYRFRLLPADVAAGLPDSLGRPEEIRFAAELIRRLGPHPNFTRDLEYTLEIRGHFTDTRPGHADWQKFQVLMTLVAHLPSGLTASVHAYELVYLVRSSDAPGGWQVAEWVDGQGTVAQPPAGETSLGRLHAQYQETGA